MSATEPVVLKVETVIAAPVEKVWEYFSFPGHITQWCSASPDWHAPKAKNDLRTGGLFETRMEAKDGSFGFDFGGVYDEVETHKAIAYTMGDGRKVKVQFSEEGGNTSVSEEFEPEATNSHEMQQGGWQAILDNFKKYVEAN